MPTYIPQRSPSDKFRTLVVLLDGTGDSVDEDVTNIVMMKEMLLGDQKSQSRDSDKQMVLYVRGIGSSMDDFDPSFDDKKTHSWRGMIGSTIDKAAGGSLPEFVQTPYRWLGKNYKDGDRICIFGFSRGAYTARVLAGIINGLGLLPLTADGKQDHLVAKAYDLYDNFADLAYEKKHPKQMEQDWLALQGQYQEFKTKYNCREPFIEFLGCWDTVNSVSYARALQLGFTHREDIKLGFTRTNDIVRTFRHAIALDEHRVKFKQSNWSGPAKEIPDSADRPKSKTPRVKTDAEEVWFAGCHCDIGGGSVPNATRPNLAHISLRWMVRECFKKNTGMIFDAEKIQKIGINPANLYPVYKSRSPESSFVPLGPAKIQVIEPQSWASWAYSFVPSFPTFSAKKKINPFDLAIPAQTEDELDADDALAPMYDQLAIHPIKWGALENMKLDKEKKLADGSWGVVEEAHKGKGRTIPPPEVQHGGKIKVHRTVRMRMEGTLKNGEKKGQKYVPLALVGYDEKKTPFEEAVSKGWIQWVA